uniref:Tight junction protein 3 n=1 Tax=Astatotilapia calliptera TaxID=8154 RepID=A0AAX7VUZ6_ASTCA
KDNFSYCIFPPQKPGMEEITIWEQHTITLNKDSKLGFGFAISGGRDKPQPDGDTSILVSDVLPNGPAMGRLFTKDQIVMVNGEPMDNVHSNYTIQTLKSCGKTANIVSTVKRPRKIQIPATSSTRPTRAASHSNLLDADPPRRQRRHSDGSDNMDSSRYRDDDRYRADDRYRTNDRYTRRSPTPERNGLANASEGKPFLFVKKRSFLDKNNLLSSSFLKCLFQYFWLYFSAEYGLKLGSQIFIKHMTETGLAAREGTLQEGDLILKINGMTTENLSLLETKHLVEKSRGKLTMTVLRDDRRFLVSIPEVEDSPQNSDYERRKDSSSELDGKGIKHRGKGGEIKTVTQLLLISWVKSKCCKVGLILSDVKTVSFIKESSLGLRLVGGNDVGIFVGGVQPHSPAYEHGMKEGDQIMQVNKVDFGHFTREEAANFLLELRTGERVEISTQHKMDIYKKILKSNLGDNFYIRTHFDHDPDNPIGLGFTRGEVFRVVDTMHRGKIGSWLAIRMGNDLHEMDKGTIPNQIKAEKMANIEKAQRATGERQATGPRAEFWKLRGLRGNKKNEKNMRRSREDLLQLTIQGKFPAYERVLLREANFKRPIVILGPLNDIAMEKLAREMPDDYEVAGWFVLDGGSTVIKLDTVRRIAEKDKHPLLDITPTAVERLNYIQYHPMVLFLDPHNRKDVKTMRQRYSPKSSKSSRRLYSQAIKMRKHCSHLFSARVDLDPSSHSWYESLKNKIRHEQTKPVWVSEVTLESGGEQDLDALDQNQTDYLSAASDLEDTDGEGFTDDAYTDNEELEEAYPGQNTAKVPGGSRVAGAALARSSEPAFEHHSPSIEPEESDDAYGVREIPPIMHVPEPRSPRHANYSPPQSDAEEEDPSHRSFTDSDFSALDVASHAAPSEGPPDFRAPDPTSQYSVDEPSYTEEEPESFQHASLSAIEDRLEQVCALIKTVTGYQFFFSFFLSFYLKPDVFQSFT